MSKHAGEAWGGVPAPPGMRGVCVSLGSYRTSGHAGGVGGAPGTSTCAGGGGGFWHLRAFCWGLGRLPAPPCMLEGLGGLLAPPCVLGGLGGSQHLQACWGDLGGSRHLQIFWGSLRAPSIFRYLQMFWGLLASPGMFGGLGGLLAPPGMLGVLGGSCPPPPPPFPGEEPQARCLNTFYARIRGLESGFWSCSLAALPPPLLCLGR